VIALDVAYGELAWSIREDPRVHVLERTNIRKLDPSDLPWRPDLIVCDVSFVGVEKVLPAIFSTAPQEFDLLAMVKPQFEVGRELVGKGGVVRDKGARRKALTSVAQAAVAHGYSVLGFASSGLPGPKGNLETFIHICEKDRPGQVTSIEESVRMVEP
jgi:23S rRNA (cytidine1920-2'-O)/16S rRNA (cytidine1409-2'-O)-methyltransferase